MGIAFSDTVVHSRKGPRRALVLTPTGHRRLGLERLEQLRATNDESHIETALVDAIENAVERYQIVIFRGRSDDGEGTWGFEEDLAPRDADDLARALVLSHLPTHRALLRHGAYVMVHTDFGPREADALRRASQILHDEMTVNDPDEGDVAIHEANVWILRHLNFYFSLNFEKVVESVLPDKLPLIELRTHNIGRLVDELEQAVG